MDPLKSLRDELESIVVGNVSDDDLCQGLVRISELCLVGDGVLQPHTVLPLLLHGELSLTKKLVSILSTAANEYTAFISQTVELFGKVMDRAIEQQEARLVLPHHLKEIKEVAVLVWLNCTPAKMKQAALDLLSQVVFAWAKTGRNVDLAIAEFVRGIILELPRAKHSATVKEALFVFLGRVAQYDDKCMEEHIEVLLRLVFADLVAETNPRAKNPKTGVIVGCLHCLNGVLYQFAEYLDSDPTGGFPSRLCYLFKTCERILASREFTQYGMPIAALELFKANFPKFEQFVLGEKSKRVQMIKDLHVHLNFWAYHKNRDVRKAGQSALERFLKETTAMLIRRIEEDSKDVVDFTIIYDYFENYFQRGLENAKDTTDYALSLRGIGYLIKLCRIVKSPEYAGSILSQMILKSETVFGGDQLVSDEPLSLLPSYLESLTMMVLDAGVGVPQSFLFVIDRLCGTLMEGFPRLAPPPQHFACIALYHVFATINRLLPNSSEAIHSILHKAFVRCCSYPPPTDGIVNAPRKQTTFRDFVLLWEKLVSFDPVKAGVQDSVFMQSDYYQTSSLVFNSLLDSAKRMLKSLDFALLSTESEADSVSPSLIPTDKAPRKEQDFTIFFNFEQYLAVILRKAERDLLLNRTEDLSYELMVLLEKNPLVAGLYRCLSLCWEAENKSSRSAVSQPESDEDQEDRSGIEEMQIDSSTPLTPSQLVSISFIRNLIERISHLTDEVLISALTALLELPEYALDPCFQLLAEPIALSLTTGSGYLLLAQKSIEVLDRLCLHYYDPEKCLPILKRCLPLLDTFLRGQTLAVKERSAATKSFKKVAGLSSSFSAVVTLESVQETAMRFLGKLGSKYNRYLMGDVIDKVESSGVGWTMEKYLEVRLPFKEAYLEGIFVDDLCPHLCHLSLSSPDRATKIAACESLHAVTVLMIGTNANIPSERRASSKMLNLIAKLFPKLLELACDVEPIAKQLFAPLVCQIVHWFSRNADQTTREAEMILNGAMDGLTNEKSSLIRDFSARCLGEYLDRALKGSSKAVPEAAQSLFEHIMTFADHPSAIKRYGAALAFNHCYRRFREHSQTVEMFILPLTMCFVRSLALAHGDGNGIGTEEAAITALTHIKRIVAGFGNKLKLPNSLRRPLQTLQQPTLKDLVHWLFVQIGRPEMACRMKCVDLFESFAEALDGSVSGPAYFVGELKNEHGAAWLLRCFTGGGIEPDTPEFEPLATAMDRRNTDPDSSLKWLDRVCAVVDAVTWALRKNYLRASELGKLEEWTAVGSAIQSAIEICGPSVERTRDQVHLHLRRQKTQTILLVRLTDLLNAVLAMRTDVTKAMPPALMSQLFRELIVRMCLAPESLGFSLDEEQVARNLPKQMQLVLRNIRQSASEGFRRDVEQSFADYLLKPENDIFQIVADKQTITHNFARGFSFVHEAGFTGVYVEVKDISPKAAASNLSRLVVNELREAYENCGENAGTWNAVDIKRQKIVFHVALRLSADFSAIFNEFALSSDSLILYRRLWSRLFAFVFDVESLTQREVMHEMLDAILSPQEFADSTVACSRLDLLRHSLAYLISNREARRFYGEKFVEHLLSSLGSCTKTAPATNSDVGRLFVDIVRQSLILSPKALPEIERKGKLTDLLEFYISILKLKTTTHSEYGAIKNQAMAFLPFFLSCGASGKVEEALQETSVEDFPIKAEELNNDTVRKNCYLESIQRLLEALQQRPTKVLFSVCMNVLMRDPEHPLRDRFEQAFQSLASSNLVPDITSYMVVVLNIVQRSALESARIDAAENVLFPMLRAANESTLLSFYSSNISSMLELELPRKPSVDLLLSIRINFGLMEILCANVPKPRLVENGSTLGSAFLAARPTNKPPTGTELIQYVTKSSDAVVREKNDSSPGQEEQWRKMRCAAYRALVAAVTTFQGDGQSEKVVKFYQRFFLEETSKDKPLWSNLVDINRKYEFKVEVDQLPKRKNELAAIQKALIPNNPSDAGASWSGIFTTTSQSTMASRQSASVLQASSLADEDLGRYDMSTGLGRSVSSLTAGDSQDEDSALAGQSGVVLESDQLNDHECMSTIIALIHHMVSKGMVDPDGVLPSWMGNWRSILMEATTPYNVKLFLARVIINVESSTQCFRHFAKDLSEPMIKLVLEVQGNGGFNQIAREILHLLLKWSISTPLHSSLASDAQKVIAFVIDNVKHQNPQIQKSNLLLLRLLTESWKPLLTHPRAGTVYGLINHDPSNAKSNIVVINIMAILLANHLKLEQEVAKEYHGILRKFLTHSSKPLYTVVAFTMGLLISEERSHGIDDAETSEELKNFLVMHDWSADCTRMIIILHEASKSCPDIADKFLDKLFFHLPKAFGEAKRRAFEVIIARNSAVEEPYQIFRTQNLIIYLADKEEAVRGLCLRYVSVISDRIGAHDLEGLFSNSKELAGIFTAGSAFIRQEALEFAMKLYERMESGLLSASETLRKSVMSKLLMGLNDPDKAIRQLMTVFWKDERRLSKNTFQRLLTVFDVFSDPSIQSSFLAVACHLMLDLCNTTPGFKEPLFKHALSDCEFLQQPIQTAWREKSFVNPVTSSTFAFNSVAGTFGAQRKNALRTPAFSLTQIATPSATGSLVSAGFVYGSQFSDSLMIDVPNANVAYNGGGGGEQATLSTQQDAGQIQAEKDMELLRRRFRQVNDRGYFIKMQYEKKKQLAESIRAEREKQGREVDLVREYRIGEDPDIQIPVSALVDPLQRLTEHDSQTAGSLLVKLFNSLVQTGNMKPELDISDVKLTKLAAHVDSLLRDSRITDPPLLSTLMQFCSAEQSDILAAKVHPDSVAQGALRSGQLPYGISTVEKMIQTRTEEPPTKRMKRTIDAHEHWTELLRLFMVSGDIDAVEGVDLKRITRQAVDLKAAVHAQNTGDIATACAMFSKLAGEETETVQQLMIDSYMDCLNALGRWDDLDKHATGFASSHKENGKTELETLWDDVELRERVLPYSMRSRIKKSMNPDPKRGDLQQLRTLLDPALKDPTRKQLLEQQMSFEMCLVNCVFDKPHEADYHLSHAKNGFVSRWRGTSELDSYARRRLIAKLQLFEETRRYLELAKSEDDARGLKALEFLKFLRSANRDPSEILSVADCWDIVTHRSFFARSFPRLWPKEAQKSQSDIFVVLENLGLASFATERHLFPVATSALNNSREGATDVYRNSTSYSTPANPTLAHRYTGIYTDYAVQFASQIAVPAKDRLKKLSQAAALNSKLLQNQTQKSTSSDFFTRLRVTRTLGCALDVIGREDRSSISKIPAECVTGFGIASISELTPEKSAPRIYNELETLCFGSDLHEVPAENYLEFFTFCDSLLDKETFVIQRDAVVKSGCRALMAALRLGSQAARDLFGRVLVWLGEHAALVNLVTAEVKDIPLWTFLPWVSQMLALLDKKEGAAVHEVLIRLAEEYPQAMIYPFKLSSANYKLDDKVSKSAHERLSKLLTLPLVEEFVRQLGLLHEPQMFFMDFLKRADTMLKADQKDQLQKEYQELYKELLAEGITGLIPIWAEFLSKNRSPIVAVFGTQGQKIRKLTPTAFKKDMNTLEGKFKALKSIFNPEEPPINISEVSPWLSKFSSLDYGRTLEIPGQYFGTDAVDPKYHVKIASFGDKVLTMRSLRKPKKIVIRGDDGKEYPFLVKGGEDLRVDQRIEQLFTLMNRIFAQDAEARKRHTSIRTYAVVPMNVNVGLLEWVGNTLPIRSFLGEGNNHMSGEKITQDQEIFKTTVTGKKIKVVEHILPPPLYSDAYLRMSSDGIKSLLAQLESRYPPYLLRDQIRKLTISTEAYILVRSMFAEAYGSLSAAQYVLGIGDRHLSNFLVSMDNGKIFPIDFGYAFGTSTQFLAVPELVPMRMTRQFTNMMTPCSRHGKLQQTMIASLKALRTNKQLLLATLDVFVQEPSMDWLHFARKAVPTGDVDKDDMSWFPREKIKVVKRKLDGDNPAIVMRDEVSRCKTLSEAVFAKAKEVVMGDEDSYRSRQPEKDLSVEQQVECLMDLATDPCVLGRMWMGWEPWI